MNRRETESLISLFNIYTGKKRTFEQFEELTGQKIRYSCVDLEIFFATPITNTFKTDTLTHLDIEGDQYLILKIMYGHWVAFEWTGHNWSEISTSSTRELAEENLLICLKKEKIQKENL